MRSKDIEVKITKIVDEAAELSRDIGKYEGLEINQTIVNDRQFQLQCYIPEVIRILSDELEDPFTRLSNKLKGWFKQINPIFNDDLPF